LCINFFIWFIKFFDISTPAPHVASVPTLLLSVNLNPASDQIQLIREKSTIDKDVPGKDNIYGSGVINAFKTYNLIKEKKTLEIYAHSIDFQYPNEPSKKLNIKIMNYGYYISDSLTRNEIVKPISKILTDYGAEASLKIISELTNYSLVKWDTYGTGRVKTQELTLFTKIKLLLLYSLF